MLTVASARLFASVLYSFGRDRAISLVVTAMSVAVARVRHLQLTP